MSKTHTRIRASPTYRKQNNQTEYLLWAHQEHGLSWYQIIV